jgi:histone-lysine N-methyltransferase SETMAR
LGAQLEAFMQKHPFASTRVIAQYYLTTIPTIKDILQRELGMRQFSRRWVPHFLSPAQKVPRVEASKSMLRVLQDAESNNLKGIATSDDSWFRYCYPSSTMFARAPSEVIPRTRQTIGAKRTMITIFFTAHQLILLGVLSKGSKFNQHYFIDSVFPDLQMENLNSRRRIPHGTFWVNMDNSICHNGSKVVSKFDKHHIARLPHPPYSPDLSPCDFWLFGMLKGILNGRGFHSYDEIEEAFTMAWNDLTFDEVQSAFHNWMNRLRWVIENGGEYITE